MLLDFALANESERDAGCEHEQRGINSGRNRKRARRSHALFEPLNVSAGWGDNHCSHDINPTYDPMQFRKPLAQAVRKLHRPQ